MPNSTRERKEVEPGDYYADISKIKRVVGWAPETPSGEGIRKTADYYRKLQEGVLGVMVKIFDLEREYDGPNRMSLSLGCSTRVGKTRRIHHWVKR